MAGAYQSIIRGIDISGLCIHGEFKSSRGIPMVAPYVLVEHQMAGFIGVLTYENMKSNCFSYGSTFLIQPLLFFLLLLLLLFQL